MDTKLKKERLYLCSPCAMVSTVVTIKGDISSEKLENAINESAHKNEILNSEILMQPDYTAYYHTIKKAQFPITCTKQNWQDIISEQIKIRFEIEKGELIRFFIIIGGDDLQLLVLNHHLAGDGLSIAYLVEDIMNSLNERPLSNKPVCLMQTDQYKPVIPLFTRLMVKSLNKTWKHTETVFSKEDRSLKFEQYWKNRNLKILTHTFEEDQLDRLINYCKENDITINSLILTACYQEIKSKVGIGVSINCRPKESKAMGNYAIGVAVPYEYDESQNFTENAVKVHDIAQTYIHNDKKRLSLMQFMNAISETLIDASYFIGVNDYQDKTAQMTANMFGYNGNPQGQSISNLGKVPIASDYGNYHLSDYRCIPPLVPNLRRILGVATLDNRLSITMNVEDGPLIQEDIEFFEDVIGVLNNI